MIHLYSVFLFGNVTRQSNSWGLVRWQLRHLWMGNSGSLSDRHILLNSWTRWSNLWRMSVQRFWFLVQKKDLWLCFGNSWYNVWFWFCFGCVRHSKDKTTYTTQTLQLQRKLTHERFISASCALFPYNPPQILVLSLLSSPWPLTNRESLLDPHLVHLCFVIATDQSLSRMCSASSKKKGHTL